MLMVPCNALVNMLLINRNEILLRSLKDQLRKDLNYEVSQKELIRFFYCKRLSHGQACCTRKEQRTVSIFLLKKQPNIVCSWKLGNLFEANGIGGLFSLSYRCVLLAEGTIYVTALKFSRSAARIRSDCWSPSGLWQAVECLRLHSQNTTILQGHL